VTKEELRDELGKTPVDINGEFKNPLKLVKDDGLFQDCVDFWQGIESHAGPTGPAALCAHLGTLEKVKISDLKSIQFGIKADKVWAILGKPGDENRPVVVVKTKRGPVLLDGNTRAFIKSEMGEKEIDAHVLKLEKKRTDGSKLFERILKEDVEFNEDFESIGRYDIGRFQAMDKKELEEFIDYCDKRSSKYNVLSQRFAYYADKITAAKKELARR